MTGGLHEEYWAVPLNIVLLSLLDCDSEWNIQPLFFFLLYVTFGFFHRPLFAQIEEKCRLKLFLVRTLLQPSKFTCEAKRDGLNEVKIVPSSVGRKRAKKDTSRGLCIGGPAVVSNNDTTVSLNVESALGSSAETVTSSSGQSCAPA